MLSTMGPTRLGGPKSDFALTWPPVCSHRPHKYLLLFKFLLHWVPFEALAYSSRSASSQPWGMPAFKPRGDPGSLGKGHKHCSTMQFTGAVPQDKHVLSTLPWDTGELTESGRG